jgi:hypothetical protein
MFWGPSIHWNTYLQRYVILVNRLKNSNFDTEGGYISYSIDLAHPENWTQHEKVFDVDPSYEGDPARWWYFQVVGNPEDQGTDRLAGQDSRFFIHGRSDFRLHFKLPSLRD